MNYTLHLEKLLYVIFHPCRNYELFCSSFSLVLKPSSFVVEFIKDAAKRAK